LSQNRVVTSLKTSPPSSDNSKACNRTFNCLVRGERARVYKAQAETTVQSSRFPKRAKIRLKLRRAARAPRRVSTSSTWASFSPKKPKSLKTSSHWEQIRSQRAARRWGRIRASTQREKTQSERLSCNRTTQAMT